MAYNERGKKFPSLYCSASLFFSAPKFKEFQESAVHQGNATQVVRFTSENSAALLTAAGVVGTVATGVLAGRGGFKANQIIAQAQLEKHAMLEHEANETGTPTPDFPPELSKMEIIIAVGPQALPALLTCAATIAAIIFANKMSAQKAAALAAAYGLAERNLSEYKEKAAEKLTGPKRQQIDDELAQDAVNRTPGHNTVIVGDGEVLCFDMPTGRWFKSTMETIKEAVNATNAEILHHDHANASFFYEELSLDKTVWSDMVGWDRDNLLELNYDSVLTDDGKPAISINFKSMPTEDYDRPKPY